MYAGLYRTMRLLRSGGRKTRRYLQELQRTQWLPRAELEAWQLTRLQQLVAYAYEHVPYYRDLYQHEGIRPQDIQSLDDIQILPFLTKEIVNANQDRILSPDFKGKLFQNHTGGSTGQPMHFMVEDSFWHWNIALRTRGRNWYGWDEGDKMAWVWGAPRDMPDWSWQRRVRAWLMRARYLNAFSMTEPKMEAFAQMLTQWHPAMFKAYASALYLFTRFVKERGITGIRPKLVETTAEKVTQPQRELFQEVYQSPVADCYSSRELATIGYECPSGSLHVGETRYVEVVANDQRVAPGQMGEIVITSLHQFAMPLIRYKIGDLGTLHPEACTCGRSMPVLKEIAGRTHDFLVTADGQFVHGEFFAYTFRPKPEVKQYQVYQPDKQHLEVRLLCNTPVSEAWLANARAEVQARFGAATEISLRLVDHIELTAAGKHRYILSDVKPDFV